MEAGEPTRESFGGILGVALGMALIPILCLWGWRNSGTSVDGEALLATVFAGPLPAGFEITDAYELPGGDRLVTLADPSFQEEELPAQREDSPDSQSDAEGSGESEGAEVESDDVPKGVSGSSASWQRVLVDEITTPVRPHTMHVVFNASPSVVTALFQPGGATGRRRGRRGGGGMESFSMDGVGDHRVLDRGSIAWDVWGASYARERTFLEAGHFSDTIRVNLSSGELLCVLYATWPRDHRPSLEELESLLVDWQYRGRAS